MIEVTGNLWDYPADVRIITTNGTIKKDGSCVMGRGCAKEAADRYPDFPKLLGKAIKQGGNNPHVIEGIITFPVKHQWFEHADLTLIRTSVLQLKRMIDPSKTYVMPRPGCGNGKREWSEVKSLLKDLPDNVYVITFAPKA